MKTKHRIRIVIINLAIAIAALLPLGAASYAYADTPTNDVCSAISDTGSCSGSGNGINKPGFSCDLEAITYAPHITALCRELDNFLHNG